MATEQDRSAESVIQGHGNYVRALALQLAPAVGLAEDIAQQVFLEFLSKAESWDLNGDVRPLLASMTRHVARRCWRERSRSFSPEMRELAEYVRTLAGGRQTSWYGPEEKEALRRCVERLPERGRRIVQARYNLDLSSADIAGQLDMREDAVRQALVRIKEQLRKCLEAALGGRLTRD